MTVRNPFCTVLLTNTTDSLSQLPVFPNWLFTGSHFTGGMARSQS